MEINKQTTVSIEAGDTQTQKLKQIVLLPLDKIIPHEEQNTGIRDKEKFMQLQENIKTQGLNNPILVRPRGEKYELIAGYHRLQVFHVLKRSAIEAKVMEVDDEKSAEMCLADNLNRIDYTPAMKEKMIVLRWKNGNYKSITQLSRKIGVSDVWIGNCLKANELRNTIKKKYPTINLDTFSSQTILDASKITGKQRVQGLRDFAALLELANKKKIKPSKIKEMATNLLEWQQKIREQVLFEGESYDRIKFELKNQAQKDTPNADKKHKITIEQINPNFVIDTYNTLDKNLKNYLTTLEDDKEKEKSLCYIKVTIKLLSKILLNEKQIKKNQYKQIYDDILGVLISSNNYNGGMDLKRLHEFYDVENSK